MPVVAVIGGISAASAGIAAWGAATGFAAVTAGLQIVGGIASVLGAVTGNEKLMKVGMVASLGASAVSGLSSLAGSAADAASGAASGASNSLMGQAPAADYASFAGKAPPGAELVKNIGGEAASLTTSSVADIASSVTSANAPLSSSIAQATSQAGTGLLGSNASKYDIAPGGKSRLGVDTSAFKIDTGAGSGAGPAGTSDSVFSKVGSFINKNPEMVKLGTGMLSGFGQAYSEQEKLKAAERMDEAKRKRMNTSITAIQSSF